MNTINLTQPIIQVPANNLPGHLSTGPEALSRENILKMTDQGRKIYDFILENYYDSDRIFLHHENCLLARNPFNGNKQSLAIKLQKGLYMHHDLELSGFTGDVFDFAKMHFRLASLEEVYQRIGKELQLSLPHPPQGIQEWLDGEDDSWRPLVSYFPGPIHNIHPSESLSLAEVHARITGVAFAKNTEFLRQLPSSKKKASYKSRKFPYVTFGGLFQQRSDRQLLQASGLMVLDLDDVKDLQAAKMALLEDKLLDTELLFVSPSGKGLKWVIRTDLSDSDYAEYFRGSSGYLKKKFGLEVDPSGKDISRACFLCHDPEAYLNPRHGVKEKRE